MENNLKFGHKFSMKPRSKSHKREGKNHPESLMEEYSKILENAELSKVVPEKRKQGFDRY